MSFRITTASFLFFSFLLSLTADSSDNDQQREKNTHWRDRKYSFFFTAESGTWRPASIDTSVLLMNTRDQNHLLANTPYEKSRSLGVKQSPVLNVSPFTTFRWGFNIQGRLLGTRGNTVHEAFLTSTEVKKQFYEGTFYFPEQVGTSSFSADVGLLIFNSVKAEQARYVFTRNMLLFNENSRMLKDLGLRLGFSGELNSALLRSDISKLMASQPNYKYEQEGYSMHIGLGYKLNLNERHLIGLSADYIDGISMGKNKGKIESIYYNYFFFGSTQTEFSGKLSGTDFRIFYQFLNIFEDTNLKIGFYSRSVTQEIISTKTKYGGLMDPLVSYYSAYPTTGGVAFGYLLSRVSDLGPMPKVTDKYQSFIIELEFKY